MKTSDMDMLAGLRRTAEDLRTGKLENPLKDFFTAEEAANMCDDHANSIEAGEIIDGEWVEEEQTPEELAAEIEAIQQVIDLLRRHDAGSLGELIERNGENHDEGI